MSWNYRVVKKVHDNPESLRAISGPTCTMYGLHEVYYDGDGRAQSVTVDPVDVSAERRDDVVDMLVMMLSATRKQVLDFDAIPEPGATPMGGGGELGLDEDGDIGIRHAPKGD